MLLGVVAWFARFLGNLDASTSTDDLPVTISFLAVATNLLLIGAFALQHSVMARPAFKKWWTQYIPPPVERSTYVLFSNMALLAIILFWQPAARAIWNASNPALRALIHVVNAGGLVLLFFAAISIDHFELVGLRQVYYHWRSRPYESRSFKEPFLYRYVRHPVYLGWIIAIWCTPAMTISRLLLAAGTTVYTLIAIPLEERDLENSLPEYREYRERVPALIPWKRPNGRL